MSSDAVTVSCVDCYIKGTVYASLVVDKDFNISAALAEVIDDFGSEVKNISLTALDTFEDWVGNITEETVDTVGTDIKNFFTGNCKSSFSIMNILGRCFR